MILNEEWFQRLLQRSVTRGELSANEMGAINKTMLIEITWTFINKGRAGRIQEADMDWLDFMFFCMKNSDPANGQLYQDIWAIYEANKRGVSFGFFVEFGVCGGKRLSNTYLLEKQYGWQGIVAEPNPNFHEELFENRSCDISTLCIYSRSGEKVTFNAAETGELSGIAMLHSADSHTEARKSAKQIEVETISLNDLLKKFNAPREIDFISIDTEGSEYEILSAFDFSQHVIHSIAVEHNGSENREPIYKLLTANGYRRKFVGYSRFDDWYVLN